MRILNFGSLNLDYVYQVDHFVQPGETLSALSRTIKAGGKGLNQSVALSRAGAAVCHAGCYGADGAVLKDLLEENGVDTEYLLPVPEAQGHTVIQVSPEGGKLHPALRRVQPVYTGRAYPPGSRLLQPGRLAGPAE